MQYTAFSKSLTSLGTHSVKCTVCVVCVADAHSQSCGVLQYSVFVPHSDISDWLLLLAGCWWLAETKQSGNIDHNHTHNHISGDLKGTRNSKCNILQGGTVAFVFQTGYM